MLMEFPSGITHFAHDQLCSYFDEHQKKVYFTKKFVYLPSVLQDTVPWSLEDSWSPACNVDVPEEDKVGIWW